MNEKSNDVRNRVINLAASYFANWQHSMAIHEVDNERDYRCRYEGAQRAAAILGIEEEEIEEYAWAKWGDEIAKAHTENNPTW